MVILAYLAVLVFMALLTIWTIQGATPPFYVPGVGTTQLQWWVRGSALALFAFSSVVFMIVYSRSRTGLLYWYSLGLALFAIHCFPAMLTVILDSPIHWMQRLTHYLGAVYLLMAVLTAFRGAGSKGRE